MSQRNTSASSSCPRPGGAAGSVARRPHEGSGPCIPFGGRRPGRTTRRAAAALAAASLLALVGAASLAACGGSSSGGSSPSASSSAPASAAPTPGSVPLTGTPRQAVAAYWQMVDADDYTGIAAAAAPGASGAITAATDDIDRVELLRVGRVQRGPGTAQVEVDVRIAPAGEATPWGEPGPHTLFVNLAEGPDGGWLVTSWGTSP